MNGFKNSLMDFRAVLTLGLLSVSSAMLFIPVVDNAEDVRSMVILLTGIAVRDYFQVKQDEARAEQANPNPPPPVSG